MSLVFLYWTGADVSVRWEQLHISYDKMKNEEEEFTAGLRKCCESSYNNSHCQANASGVSWTAVFQPTDPAEIVVSGAYKSSQDCYFAVCYGLPIVSEQWLYTLENRFRACWKKVADSEDSFSLPDAQDERFRPPLDPSLRNTSATLGFWIPRPGNRTLFNGWHVIGLKTTKVGFESCAALTPRPSRTSGTTSPWARNGARLRFSTLFLSHQQTSLTVSRLWSTLRAHQDDSLW